MNHNYKAFCLYPWTWTAGPLLALEQRENNIANELMLIRHGVEWYPMT